MAKAPLDNSDAPVVEEEKDSDESILREARDRFQYSEDVDGDNRKAAVEDTRFVYVKGAQWDDETREKRKKWKLPCLEFNQLRPFVHQVVNDQRQGRPGVIVHPSSGDASEKVAELKQDLIRGIEYKSDAESAYDTGFLHTVVGGRGYWRITTDYESPKSFYQCIKIDRLPDPESVRVDPDWQKADASDLKWAFVVEPVKKEDYKRRFKSAPLSWEPADENKLWYKDEETVLVADYYRLVTKERELVLLADGSVVWADEVEDAPAGAIVSRRMGEDTVCEWYTLAGGEKIVKRNEWKGRYVPVIVCLGDEIVVDGKRVTQGLIRHAREPQQLYNFGMTQQAQSLALTPKAPFIAPVAAIETHEAIWKTANVENYSVLPYNDFKDGRPIAPPQRQQPSFPDAGWVNWSQQMTQQIRATLGMFEDAIGMRGQAQSGRAILAREQQGDNATFHFLDNLRRAIAHTGRVIDDLIPHYYDTERLVALVAQDGKRRLETVNEQIPAIDPEDESAVRHITNPDNDLTRGEYSVTVEAGPSYSTKREQARLTMVELMQASPQAAMLILDKIVRLIDMPEADEVADRIKAMLPPQIQQMEAQKEQQGKGAPAPDPAMVAQMQQMQGQMQQAMQALQQLQAENEQLKQGAQVKLAAAQTDAEVERAKAELDAQTEIQKELIKVAGQLFASQIQPPPAPAGVEAPAPEPQPMLDMQTIMEGLQATAQQLAAVMLAPKQLQVQYDEAGNVVGGVSQPILQ